ncbi:unnamed protein product [Rotaria magnacalcarata]|uniref:Uncharacterized protein n=1 Tax=Rotaria magnacalcarata TaxID=392030 RepID=A0A819NZ60_9BILA|nr:unnamed protein product [Rotaria magnacalcarata]
MLLDTLLSDHSYIASIYLELSHVSDEKGNYDLALEHAERTLHIRKEQKPVDQIRLASTLNGMGVMYKKKSDLDRAISSGKHLHQANTLTNLCIVSKDKELLPADHPRRVNGLSNIGSIYHHRRNFEQALNFYQQALDIQDKSCPDDHLRKANTIRNIALIYRDKQDCDNALNCLNRALNMYRNVLDDKPHPSIAVCYGDIGHVYGKKGNWDQALDYYRRQLNMEELCLSIDHPHIGLHFDWIVNMLKKKGNIDEAKHLCQQELNKLPDLFFSLATILEDSDFNKSQDYYKQAVSVLERQPGSTAHRACLSAMINFFWKSNMHDEALVYQLKLVDLQRTNLSSNNKEIAVSLRGLARLYQTINNDKEATKYFNQRLDIFQVIYGPEHNYVKEISNELGQLRDSVTISNAVGNEKKMTLIIIIPQNNRCASTLVRLKKRWLNGVSTFLAILLVNWGFKFFHVSGIYLFLAYYFLFFHFALVKEKIDFQNQMTFPSLFAHIDGIEAVLVLDKDGTPILKLPSTEVVDRLNLQAIVPSAQTLQEQSSRMHLKKLKTVVTYWATRQIITYNVPPLAFIIAANTNVNTGALINLYSDLQKVAIEDLFNKS